MPHLPSPPFTSLSTPPNNDPKMEENLTHKVISAYFLGPRAENISFLRNHVFAILDELEGARMDYFPDDEDAITEDTQSSPEFRVISNRLSIAIRRAAALLAKHSIPTWSPRYGAHMCSDLSMPAMLGYFMAMLYNPNNITPEVSPLTTEVEADVGNQFCRLFGYNTGVGEIPRGWGHVTSGGTVANLEAMWVARNLKYYPLALWRAIAEGELGFLSYHFSVKNCAGDRTLFMDLDTWDLLNLRPEVVLDFPRRLNQEFGISKKFLDEALARFSINNVGKDVLDAHFQIGAGASGDPGAEIEPARFIMGKTHHYSWSKGGGIGANNVVGVEVDNQARVDLDDLERHLEFSLNNKQAVYAVVVMIGSTEEGAVDRLGEILDMRERFQARGLSFLVHADAAWGGYYATMLPRDENNLPTLSRLRNPDSSAGLHGMTLKPEVEETFVALRFADSITVDPHKAGYIPYPAGGIVYRDSRMTQLVHWTSPYLSQGSDVSMGIYGIEGSKPGAAAMSIWLSNKCIGMDRLGYGGILSEVTFNSAKMSAYWATLTSDQDIFTCIPFNMLPSELKTKSTTEDVNNEKARIRNEILPKSYVEILAADANRPAELSTMTLLQQLGSDLNINAFALNWRYPDGTLNTDVEEANYFMRRVVKRLSVDSPDVDPTTVPFYLTSTELSADRYGKCVEKFKSRLQVTPSPHNLFVLRSVTMNPFSSQGDIMTDITSAFRKVVEEEVQICRLRNSTTPEYHRFVMQGPSTEIFLLNEPCFAQARYRRQVILSVTLPKLAQRFYHSIKERKPRAEIFLQTSDMVDLTALLDSVPEDGEFSMQGVMCTSSNWPITTTLTIKARILKNRPLSTPSCDPTYPTQMPFYLYGGSTQCHIWHMLLKSPNVLLKATDIQLDLDAHSTLPPEDMSKGVILTLADIHEASRHPFLARNGDIPEDFFFRPGRRFRVLIWRDPRGPGDKVRGVMGEILGRGGEVARGWIQLGVDVDVDVEGVNEDEFGVEGGEGSWRKEFERIGR